VALQLKVWGKFHMPELLQLNHTHFCNYHALPCPRLVGLATLS